MLLQPRYTVYKHDIRRCVSPLGLAYLGAFLRRHGYTVEIIDISAEGYNNLQEEGDFITYGLEEKEIKKRITEFSPQVVGVSCIFTTQSINAKRLLKLVKELDDEIITSIGGVHPTFAVEEMLACRDIDYIVMGEGEQPFLQLLDALNSGGDVSKIGGLAYRDNGTTVINHNLQYIEDINHLPFPARDLLNMELYFKINTPHNPYCLGQRVTQIITSRGCSAHCTFCSTTNFWGNRYRGRSAESVVAEIRQLKEQYNIDEIQWTDDNFTSHKKRAMDIVEGIKALDLIWCAPNGTAVWTLDEELIEKMRESGCYQLTFAIESGNQEVLNKIVKKPLNLKKVKPLVKKAHDIGIKVHAFCICGLPGEKIEQMHQTYNFVEECGFETASFFAATPLPGSELLKICKEKGYLEEFRSCNDMLFKRGNISTPDFKAEEIQKLVEHFNKSFNEKDSRKRRFQPDRY